MLRRTLTIAAVLTVALLGSAPAALGHTQMEETVPAEGAVLDASPPQVIVVFNDAIQEDRSSVVVLDEAGATIAEGGLDPADATRLVADLPPLESGRYIVRYTAYSQDNELLRDQFEFQVALAATPTPTSAPTATPTAQPDPSPTISASPEAPEPTDAPTDEPSPAPTDAPDGGTSDSPDAAQILIPLLVGGAIVAVVAFLLMRRRQS